MASVTALMINQVSGSVINDYKGRFGSEVTISANMDKVREEAMSKSTDGKIRVATQLFQLNNILLLATQNI